jgi:membrane associated rhomboid family serine protease
MNGYSRGLMGMPPVVKNLIFLNVIMLVADLVVRSVYGIELTSYLGLYFPKSDLFQPFQLVTHMFMHGSFFHLFFNMFALYMFGGILESVWGPKRFFIYYMVCGLGAAFIHESVIAFQYSRIVATISPDQLQMIMSGGRDMFNAGAILGDNALQALSIMKTPTVGASGAIFGILLAFGVLFPNTQLMLLFPPIPIKAKYLVIGYGAIELYLAITQPGSNIAHAAHLGGMLFGYILIRIWRKTTTTLY